ncbi:uncharacterized protein LOC116247674 isoform X2 [Nymphaea colorata]|uniref:uncharacterized protein LOC116247674 isoform X2 n=1 Tax=Nymphaea colorata TaxID=210225 RepID=UPI00214E4D2E|nr:uncharacterized protein LOC116247674 isoform X2 [Nymphaea colorata]
MLEDKQKTASGINSHGVWVCHKCGWTYPNPHPSAKHRRNHKKHCGKLGNVIVSPRERSSSPDSDDDLHEEEHSFPAKSNGTQDQVAEKSVITEVHEISNRVEEEEFADAVTDFSEASQSPNNEVVQVGRNDHPGSVNRSLSGSLFHDHESVAFKTDNRDRGTEGLMGPKSPAGFDSIEVSSLQIDSTESLKAERHEDSVGLMGKPVHSHVQHIVGLRKDGLACILEQDSPIKEASDTIGGDASVSILNHKGEGHVTQQQSDHLLGTEVELPEVSMSSSDLSACLTTDLVEPKCTSSSTSSLPGAADMETENGPPKNTMAKICEHDKGHAESEIEIDMSHKYWEGTNESRGFLGYRYEKVVMPSCLEASTEIDDPLKVSVVPSDAPGAKICSERETQDVAPVMQISPEEPSLNETSGSGTVITGELNAFSLNSQVTDRSVLIDADIRKAVAGNCQQHGAKTCDHKKSNDEDVPISTAPEAWSPGHDTNIISDVYEDPNLVKVVVPSVHTINVESEKTTRDDSKLYIACQENVGESGPHVELAPLTSINPGTFLKDSSGGHEDPDLINQEPPLGPPVIEALTDIADNSEVGVAYSNRPHIVSSSVTDKEGFAPTQDTKALGVLDREQDLNIRISSNVQEGNGNSLEYASSMYNAVIIYDETISDHSNACAGHRERPPPPTLSEDKCGIVDSESVCNDNAVHSGGLGSFPTVAPENVTQIVESVVELVIPVAPMERDMPPAVTDDEVTEIRDVIPSEDEKACYAEENILLAYGERGDQILDLKRSMEKHVVVSSMVYAPAKREHEEEKTPFVPHIQEKLHLELQPNQSDHEFLIDSTGSDMAMHVAEEEKSSHEHLTEACNASSANPLEDSATKDSIRELIHSDAADGFPVEEQKILPITDDAKAIERRESAIPAGDANSSSSYEKTIVVCKELDEQFKDFKGSPNKHVDDSSMVLAPVERELKEDQLPSDPQCQKKVHKKIGSNQNHLDESQNNIKVNEIALHISDDEKSSSAYLTKSSGPCFVSPLEDSSLKEPRPEMVELASSDGTKIKDLQSEDGVTTSKSYVETSASGVNGTHAPICQTDNVEGGDNFPTGNVVLPPVVVKAEAGNQVAEKADSSVSLKINVVSEAHQNSGNLVAEEAPSSDNLKTNVVSEAHQNSDGADMFEPPSFMTLVEVAGDHGAKLKPPEMKPEYAVQKPTSPATEAAWFPSLPSVVNDSGARKKNEESITKAVNSKRARTPLKNLLVENTEKGGTKVEDLKATAKDDVKSEGTLVMKTKAETKAPELESDKVRSSKFKLDSSATITASTGIISPPKLFGNKKDKRKNRGLHSWMYVCCSSIN